ncbi:hypothetical protein GCM10010921_20380 [Microbacterium album]|uniref:Beta-lactamase-related domain-containing protein n=2 Tax=Microbacterium album TaxID=2053191 RepID=A0A917MP44_9MICO|nr:hypothetical protein GCM10010921_20380 [Microbacterium album]
METSGPFAPPAAVPPARDLSDAALWEVLERLRAKHGVVGAQVAIDRAGTVSDAASGLLNVEMGSTATTDALFQIGSITKVWTATLVMQLVDEGVLDLDAPVVTYLPDLPSAEPQRMARVTVRHLLTHSSGIEGDVFTDTGRGDDCLARYVDGLGGIGFVHAPGALTSYSNTSYVIAGRLIEAVTGRVWDDVLRERLVEPLGLTHTETLPERLPRYAVAHGHAADAEGRMALVPRWSIPRSSGPAGIIAARARDVAAFARMHLADGVAPGGHRILSAASVAEMRREQSAAPELARRGIGWGFEDWSDTTHGHDGATYGQLAFLRVVPEHDLVVVLLTNGGDGITMFAELAAEALGIEVPPPPRPPVPLPDVDLARFAGTFRRHGTVFRLTPDGDGIAAEITQEAAASDSQEETTIPLRFVATAEDTIMTQFHGSSWFTGHLVEVDGVEFLHFGGRANRRVD